MMTIRALLDKIKWDPREHPEEYTLHYLDRKTQALVELRYADIKRIEDGFLIVIRAGEEVFIPLHRIREVRKTGELVWSRRTRG